MLGGRFTSATPYCSVSALLLITPSEQTCNGSHLFLPWHLLFLSILFPVVYAYFWFVSPHVSQSLARVRLFCCAGLSCHVSVALCIQNQCKFSSNDRSLCCETILCLVRALSNKVGSCLAAGGSFAAWRMEIKQVAHRDVLGWSCMVEAKFARAFYCLR